MAARQLPTADVFADILQFLTRAEVERDQMTCRFMHGVITRVNQSLAWRRIAYVLIVDNQFPGHPFRMCCSAPDRDAAIPRHVRHRRRAAQDGYSGPGWTNIYDVPEAMRLLRYAFIENCVVYKMPYLAVQQSLAATPMAIDVLRYISSLGTPTPLQNAVHYNRLEWHIAVRTVIDDQRLLGFVFDAQAPVALRIDYTGRLSSGLLLEFIQRMINRLGGHLPVAALCLNLRTPAQHLGIYNNLKDGPDDDWTLRIDDLDLGISWHGERLSISNNHRITQHCSCFASF